MANQESFIKLTGKVGDLSFRKTSKGYTAHQKAKIDPKVLQNSPKAQVLREHKAEFTRSAIYSKMLRDAIRPITQYCKDRYHLARVNAAMLRVIKADAENPSGARKMNTTVVQELTHFEFNSNVKLDAVYFPIMEPGYDNATYTTSLKVPAFKNSDYFKFPKEATFAKLKLSMAMVDFESGESRLSFVESEEQFKDEENTVEQNLSVSIEQPINGYAFAFLGVEYYRNVNGFIDRLYNGVTDALKIVSVNPVTV